ncbi:hypothetical protein ACLOJK_034665 [Asimina triloba]
MSIVEGSGRMKEERRNSQFRVRSCRKKDKIALEQIHWDKDLGLLPWHWAQETEEMRVRRGKGRSN